MNFVPKNFQKIAQSGHTVGRHQNACAKCFLLSVASTLAPIVAMKALIYYLNGMTKQKEVLSAPPLLSSGPDSKMDFQHKLLSILIGCS